MSTRYKNRRSVPEVLRVKITKRDGYKCQKCGRIARTGQDVHHITHVIDGGSDDPDNLITLCHSCHEEWHFITRRMPKLDFRAWLDIPSAASAIHFFVFGVANDAEMTVSRFREQTLIAWREWRDEGWEPEDFMDDEDADDLDQEPVPNQA